MAGFKWIVGAFVFLLSTGAWAELKIDVSGAISEPIPIAVPVFKGESEVAQTVTDIVVADLERSGLFRLINRDAYIQQDVHTQPAFPDWQAIQAHALLSGEVAVSPQGQVKASYRLWDVFAQSQMDAKAMTTDRESVRKLSHMIADSVYERMTGEKGYFDTKIVFVSEKGPQNKRVKRLAVMDQDGANFRYLSDGKDMNLTPRFSPSMQKITYFSYKGGYPKVYLMDLATGTPELVGQFKGMSFAPRFSPKGDQLIMSLAYRGNTDIYVYNLKSGEQKRLTTHPAIDTSPSYAPDGKRVVFSSDRSGTQQLYIMDSDGDNIRRISFGEGTYATPVWSPRGDYIAFTKIKEGIFHIGVMHPDGTGERLITSGFMVEAPTWSPNGRVLAYFKQTPWDKKGRGGSVRLYSIDITGYHEQLLPTPEDASSPAWSPLLH